jgi:LysM repeat protein
MSSPASPSPPGSRPTGVAVLLTVVLLTLVSVAGAALLGTLFWSLLPHQPGTPVSAGSAASVGAADVVIPTPTLNPLPSGTSDARVSSASPAAAPPTPPPSPTATPGPTITPTLVPERAPTTMSEPSPTPPVTTAARVGITAPFAGEVVYIVAPGDTLVAIATRFGVDVNDLAGLNELEDPDFIFPGEKLHIPVNP